MIIDDPQFSVIGFYERRARRIVSALAVVVFVSSITAYVFFMPDELAGFGKSVAATALFSSNIVFWRETGYFDAPSPPELKPLLHTWSLAVD